MMSLDAIKRAVADGKKVHWKTRAYVVIEDRPGHWMVKCTLNNSCIGLTWRDGVTMNGKPEDFFVDEPHEHHIFNELAR